MKKLILLLFIAGIILSCNENEKFKNDRYGVDQLEADLKSGNKDLGYEGCAVLIYPVDYSMPDGTVLTIRSEDEVTEVLGKWYQNNPDSRQRPVMVYPVRMAFNEKTYTLNGDDEMRRIRKACNAKKRIFYEEHKEKITQLLLEKGFERERIKSLVGPVVRALDDARGKGRDYIIDDRLKEFLVNDSGLADDELETIRLLIIQIANG